MIALYKGTSPMSRFIRWVTWGEYSHASWIDAKKGEYEAWQLAGTVYNDLWGSRHTPGTVVDIFDFKEPLTQIEIGIIETFLKSHLGEKYDWAGVLAFIPVFRMFKEHSKGKWFCSEEIVESVDLAGRPLYEKPSSKTSPSDISFCTLLYKKETWIVPDRPSLVATLACP